MTPRREPSHSLEAAQKAVAKGDFVVSAQVLASASLVLCDRHDIADCICNLSPRDFYKSMESDRRPGRWQDVYRTRFAGFRVYVKFDLVHGEGEVVVVLSFKVDEAAP